MSIIVVIFTKYHNGDITLYINRAKATLQKVIRKYEVSHYKEQHSDIYVISLGKMPAFALKGKNFTKPISYNAI